MFSAGASDNISTGFHWHATSPTPATADLTALAALVATAWDSHLGPLTPNNVTLDLVEAIDLGNAGTMPGAWSGSHPGTYPTTMMTAESAVLINHTIARRYRGGKPRNYLPLGTSSQLNNPVQWQSTFVSQATADFGTFKTQVTTNPPGTPYVDQLVNVSYFEHKVLRPTPVTDLILNSAANPIPASQRRRMHR
jgi:hypothetical protein